MKQRFQGKNNFEHVFIFKGREEKGIFFLLAQYVVRLMYPKQLRIFFQSISQNDDIKDRKYEQKPKENTNKRQRKYEQKTKKIRTEDKKRTLKKKNNNKQYAVQTPNSRKTKHLF